MKRRGDFHFKKFSVSHNESAHKVGTDGVLLGAWANVHGAKHILDIGTGSGVIALMLAQRSDEDARIEAVEIQERGAREARMNVQRSPWPEKIKIHHISIQAFFPNQSFDLIVSNPPFFIDSLASPVEERTKARHSSTLTFSDIVTFAINHLVPTGRLAVVLPEAEGKEFEQLAADSGLHVQRKLVFRSRKHKPVERLLMEFTFAQRLPEITELVLYAENDNWTTEYRKLLSDFYLKA